MITIILNGESRKLDRKVDLDKLIDLFSLPRDRVAVELNKTVIRRSDWGQTMLNDGDSLEVVHFVGGG